MGFTEKSDFLGGSQKTNINGGFRQFEDLKGMYMVKKREE